MKVVILNASPRKKGLVSQMLEIIQENLAENCEVETIHVNDLSVRPCIGCMKCRSSFQCCLPEDDAQRTLQKIKESDALIIGSPCYWGNINGYLKVLFDRMVYGMMDENKMGIPIPLHKGKRAIIVTTCTTIFPFNILFKQTRGVVNALREILKWSGFKIIGTIEKGGTKKHHELSEREKNKCKKLAQKLLKQSTK
ncbi:MAG: flavodoxin family protein [Paludibacteraceae bacterium]|nr:flavodoxin family protein [Paludibacteraceae bacterium]